MASAECLRDLINERLTAAAEEIFRAFQTTIIKYEEQIDRQSRLLDLLLKPKVKLHTTELPRQDVCKEEEVLSDQQLCNQERNSGLDQDNPAPPQIKEVQEELCISLEREQLVPKQETEDFMLTPTCEGSDNREDQSAAEKEHIVIMSVKSLTEPNGDDQLPSHNSHVAESQGHKGGKRGDSGSTRNAEPKPKKRRHKSINHTDIEANSTALNIHSDTGEKLFEYYTCGKSFKTKSNFHSHLRVHIGEKPYMCNTCEKRFSHLETLKNHISVHIGEKP